MTVQEEIAWQISEALRLKLTGAQKNQAAEAAHRERRGVAGVPARPVRVEQLDGGRLPPGGRALRARDWATTRSTRRRMPASPTATGPWRTTASCRPRWAIRARARRRSRRSPSTRTSPTRMRPWRSSHLLWQFDWAAAEREFTTALRLNPQLAVAHATYALFLVTVGRHEEAIQQARMAQRARSAVAPHQHDGLLGAALRRSIRRRHPRDATDARARAGIPGGGQPPDVALRAPGQVRRGRALDVRAADLWGPRGRQCAPRGLSVRRRGGLLAKAHSTLSTRAQPKRLRPFTTATRRSTRGLGDTERAIDHVEALIESRASNAVFIGGEPCLRSLHGEPRFQRVHQPAGCAHGFSTAYSVDDDRHRHARARGRGARPIPAAPRPRSACPATDRSAATIAWCRECSPT